MKHRLIIILSAVLILTGCAPLHLEPYGIVAPDGESVREDGGPVFLPEGAPSIMQGFNLQPEPQPRAGHEGIDIYARTGTPVIAPASGIVTDSYFEPFYGNRVIIEYGRDENGRDIFSRLLHLDKRLVSEGEKVLRGQPIGTLGSTGLLASYPHLHYEIRVRLDGHRSYPVNPHIFWADGAGVVTCFDNSMELPGRQFSMTYPVSCRK
jgi:murein DD-endopeptidase MepM/ murein hydrolase activator NlpD